MNAARELHNQVMWNRLISIVEEQALTLVRTAFSTSVREAGDLSAGVFDTEGRMIAQAVTGTPGHVNTMAAAVGHFIDDIGPERIYPGDVYITNDPWKGTGHLHDITVTTPVFRDPSDDTSLVGFFASTAHVVDVGGRGYGPEAREVYEEGVRIPILKWVERGELNDDLVTMVRWNVRESDQVIGDIHGLAACNETGRRRLLSMLEEFELDDLDDLAAFVFDRTRSATMAALTHVPRAPTRTRWWSTATTFHSPWPSPSPSQKTACTPTSPGHRRSAATGSMCRSDMRRRISPTRCSSHWRRNCQTISHRSHRSPSALPKA
jgi:N-methylhydantoinase B